jgi:hypothetical protein
MIYRGIAVLAGIAILTAAAHVTIEHTGGYGTAHAVLTMAIAGGVAVGALILGVAWSHGRYAIAVALAVALLCGEGFGLLRTAERLVEDRAIKAAPLTAAHAERQRAHAAVMTAIDAQKTLSDTSPRLTSALNAQRAAQTAIAESAAKRGCASNCRQLLQAAVDTASAEVAAARRDIAQQKQQTERNVVDAKAALAAIAPARSASPLAAALGVAPWAMDLIVAALGSIGANGLGAVLLAFGGHAPSHRQSRIVDAQARVVSPAPRIAKVHNEHDHIKSFATAQLAPDDNATVTFEKMVEVYQGWCRAQKVEALPLDRAAELFAELVNHLELKVEQRDGDPVIIGLRVERPMKLIEAA